MREPAPDQTASIITTTLPSDTGNPDVGDLPALDSLAPEVSLPVTDTAAPGSDPSDTAGQVVPGDDALALDGFEITLPWAEGGEIPQRFTCDGRDVSPAISWVGLPEGTVEVAIVVLDTDANSFAHWLVAGIDPATTQVEEGAPLTQAIVGTNDAGTLGWSGPCPPAGETHTYEFEVHALSQQVEVPTGATAEELLRSIDFATVAAAFGTGVYTRA